MQTLFSAVGKVFSNWVVYALAYMVLMLPTYFLPYAGSNSAVVAGLGAAAGAGLSPQFWTHVACLYLLVVITWLRGCAISKQWIAIFPLIASFFDMVPGVNLIPLIPTVMHICALVVGARGSVTSQNVPNVPFFGGIAALVGALSVTAGLIHGFSWRERAQPINARVDITTRNPTPNQQTVQRAIGENKAGTPAAAKTNTIVGGWYNGGDYRAQISYDSNTKAYLLRIWNNESQAAAAFQTYLFEREGKHEFADSRSKRDGDGLPAPKVVVYNLKSDLLQIYLNEGVRDKNNNIIGPGSNLKFKSDFVRDEASNVK